MTSQSDYRPASQDAGIGISVTRRQADARPFVGFLVINPRISLGVVHDPHFTDQSHLDLSRILELVLNFLGNVLC